MLRLISILGLILFIGAVSAAEAPPPLSVRTVELPSPAAAGASGASLTTASDGTVWLSWLEPSTDGATSLRCAVLDRAAATWSPPRLITAGRTLLVSEADVPALASGVDGRVTAAWPVSLPAPAMSAPTPAGHPHHEAGCAVFTSQSSDRGATWSVPAPLSRESAANEFVSLQPLADGRVLAAWLDGRGKHGDRGAQQLFARIIGEAGPDQLVDGSVCDCCQTTLTGFPDGSVALAYRGRTREEIRDIQVARFQTDRWSSGRPLASDRWQIAGCPVNGPQLASSGGRVAAAWFTAANNEARVLASVSPDAGLRFLQPWRIDQGHPLGRVDTVMLADGTAYVTWLESAAGQANLWLRRISSDGELGQSALLAPRVSGRSFPRMTVVKDYDATAAQLAVVLAGAGQPATLRTLLVTLPDLSTLAGRKPCVPCDEADAQAMRGYPVRGRVVSVRPERAAILVQHEEIPGVMRAMTMEFRADPDVLATAKPGRELLARIERRGQPWWIFGVKWLGANPG